MNEISRPADGYGGYSNEELEMLCKVKSRFEKGIVPWASWEAENSSFGKTFRVWARFPSFLPLFICSDHGVNWGTKCWPNEIESPYKAYFTWNRKKNDFMVNVHKKKSYHVPHPWIFYRQKNYPRLPDNRFGTLVFYAHSNANTTPSYENLEKYIADLKSLPEKYHPLVICLSFHDINKGLHKELRKYGLPLVTAGTTNSQKFVDRFYSLLYRFKYCSSSNIGSHTFYIVEAGIPFFLYGPYPEYNLKGSKYVKDGRQDINDYGEPDDVENFEYLKRLLSSPVDQVTPEQHQIVSKYLGLTSDMSRLHAAWVLWRALLMHIDDLIVMYLRLAKGLLSKVYSLLMPKAKT
jgi:hypothetical protein